MLDIICLVSQNLKICFLKSMKLFVFLHLEINCFDEPKRHPKKQSEQKK